MSCYCNYLSYCKEQELVPLQISTTLRSVYHKETPLAYHLSISTTKVQKSFKMTKFCHKNHFCSILTLFHSYSLRIVRRQWEITGLSGKKNPWVREFMFSRIPVSCPIYQLHLAEGSTRSASGVETDESLNSPQKVFPSTIETMHNFSHKPVWRHRLQLSMQMIGTFRKTESYSHVLLFLCMTKQHLRLPKSLLHFRRTDTMPKVADSRTRIFPL